VTAAGADVEGMLRRLAPQVLGRMVARHGQFDACEDAVQEALLAAAMQWPREGVPVNAVGWLLTVATRRLTDEWRRDSARRNRERLALTQEPLLVTLGPELRDEWPAEGDGDDTLNLLFLCCHPALTPSAQIALTLRAVGGLTTAQIARAFLLPEDTMARRITRSKQRIKESGARFASPPAAERAERVQAVLQVLYLIFNEGYTASGGHNLIRAELTTEAIRLARALRASLPDDGEVAGLLALMLLTDAHRASRVTPDGALIALADQDRTRWNGAAIDEGITLVTAALTNSPAGPYQLQAAIAAVHAEARRAEDTDWRQIVALYRQLERVAPNPMVALNHAAAVAMVDGPRAGLDLLAALEDDEHLARNHRLPAVRAHLLEMAGEPAAAAYRDAARRTTSLPERRYLESRAARLEIHRPHRPGAATMHSTKADTVTVPGATLYYEVQGAGPLLMLICGGIYDARAYAGLAGQLADRYTVLTYDRRGNSRSPLDGPPTPLDFDVQADDAHRLLTTVGGDEPAHIFGNSSGAMIGMQLAVQHPDQVRTVVVHEPPIFELLPERDHWREVIKNVEDTFERDGAGPAMQVFGAGFGGGPEEWESDAEGGGDEPPPAAKLDPEEAAHLAEVAKAMEQNLEIFVGYEVPPVARYVPDFATLRASSVRIVAAAGAASGSTPMYEAAAAVAREMGTQLAIMPGDHGGFDVQSGPFAAELHRVLSRPQ
jgi:predicted RNA polymerase sigma factor/pimeloyl-ACP methyl ester carboxylesterase